MINKFNTRNPKLLAEIEANYTALRLDELVVSPIAGEFNAEHLATIHKHIFQDIFDWAGELRTVNILREEPVLGGLSIEYTDHTNIDSRLTKELESLNMIDWSKLNHKQRVIEFSRRFASIWQIHPFREGNTRTITTFMCDFAKSKDFALNTEVFKNNATYLRTALVAAAAVFDDLGDKRKFEYLEKVIDDALK
ncbi:MAG: Fic family protein [Candidatus Nomurabacteria bacterium]|nr:Fic family protein [Candidatus Nomurabacteria bacterium]